ncbi:MAG: ATP-binding cassette domain-containing protein [Terriglobia bacterium]
MLRLIKISKRFNVNSDREVVALDSLDFELSRGEFVIMVGANGSGKTTLFRIVTGAVAQDGGRVLFGDIDASKMPAHRRARFVTHIQQSRESGLPLSLTVEEVMRLAFESRNEALTSGGVIRQKAQERLESLRKGLGRILKEQIWHLSGGEHQLVNLAVASVFADGKGGGSHVLLLDEHVSQLDPVAHHVVMEATNGLIRERQLSALMATHNVELAARYGDRQVVLSQGRILREFAGESRIRSPEELTQVVSNALE